MQRFLLQNFSHGISFLNKLGTKLISSLICISFPVPAPTPIVICELRDHTSIINKCNCFFHPHSAYFYLTKLSFVRIRTCCLRKFLNSSAYQGMPMAPAVQPILLVHWMAARSGIHYKHFSWLPAKYMCFLVFSSPKLPITGLWCRITFKAL